MRSLVTSSGGELTVEDLAYFGGKLSLWERIKKGGIGSTKLIYDSGIEEFDKLSRNIAGEIGFVNFELLRNGLLLRLNIGQRIACLGIKLSAIKAINLMAYQIKIKDKKINQRVTKIVHRGDLEVVEIDSKIKFTVTTSEFKSIVDYFEKEAFKAKFNYSISTNPPEEDILIS